MDNVIRQIRRMAGRPLATQTDEELLEQFFSGEDEDAFAILIRRHGAMVLGVCLRLLHHRQDAEDAFQATFLTLVRKGHLIRQRGALSSWLYRVAFRVSLRLKAKADKKPTEVLTEVAVECDPSEELAWRELRPMLDTEVSRLPAKYRAPIILCYLEGKTYEEAAGELGCPKGTIAIRLLRGKVLLKNRLARRGLALSAGFVAATTAIPQAHATIPVALQSATAMAAVSVASGTALSSAVSVAVAGLVRAIGHDIGVKKLQMALLMLLGISLTGVGVGTVVSARADRTIPQVAEASATGPLKADAVPSVAKVIEPERLQPAEPIPPNADHRQSFLVVEFTIGSGCNSDDADHLLRNTHRPLTGSTPSTTNARNCPHSGKCPQSGLALRENLNDDALPRCAAPTMTERKTIITKTAIVYRFRFANGDEIQVIIINPV